MISISKRLCVQNTLIQDIPKESFSAISAFKGLKDGVVLHPSLCHVLSSSASQLYLRVIITRARVINLSWFAEGVPDFSTESSKSWKKKPSPMKVGTVGMLVRILMPKPTPGSIAAESPSVFGRPPRWFQCAAKFEKALLQDSSTQLGMCPRTTWRSYKMQISIQ